MAKDGSNRGGRRPGAGRKKKTAENVENVAKIIQMHSGTDVSDLPAPNELLSEKQGGEIKLKAGEIYYSIFRWLKENHSTAQVPKELVELFAMSYARWQQAERLISQKGFLAPHPTTNVPYTSPLVQIAAQYAKQAQQYWYSIWSAVKEADAESDDEDIMSKMLNGRIS